MIIAAVAGFLYRPTLCVLVTSGLVLALGYTGHLVISLVRGRPSPEPLPPAADEPRGGGGASAPRGADGMTAANVANAAPIGREMRKRWFG